MSLQNPMLQSELIHPVRSTSLRDRGRTTITTYANYASELPPDPAVDLAKTLRDQIATKVKTATTLNERWRQHLDPRPLLQR